MESSSSASTERSIGRGSLIEKTMVRRRSVGGPPYIHIIIIIKFRVGKGRKEEGKGRAWRKERRKREKEGRDGKGEERRKDRERKVRDKLREIKYNT